jgi:hypothetical protein
MPQYPQSRSLIPGRKRERKRRENKRRAKRQQQEGILPENWKENPILRPLRTHAGKHSKNQYSPDSLGQPLIADCGWNKLVRIYDTATNETRPPCSGTFKIEGWGGGGSGGRDIPFFLRKGPFPWDKLPLELK